MSQLNPTNIADRLRRAETPAERSRLVRQLADEKGVSAQSIYTAAKRGGFALTRKKRADAGTRMLPVTDEQLSQIAKLIHQSHTEKGRIPLPAHEAIRLAEQHGLVTPGVVTEAYLNAWMRSRQVSKQHALRRTPHTPLMSKYPNHVHMIDASQCAQWYIGNKGEVAHQRRNMDVYSNKDGDRRKITRLMLIDHYTGAFFVWYVASETARDWIDFLYLAWSDKSFLADRLAGYINTDNLSALYPFSGMPEMVYADNGSPIKASITRRVLDNLGIHFDTHMPYNPRAKGANETMQRHWERWFEGRLKLQPASSIEELNAWAFDTALAINSNRLHTRHGHTRFDFWRAGMEQVRQVPDYDFYKSYATSDPDVRKVAADGTIRFKPRHGVVPFKTSGVYRVPDVNLRGGEVEVSYCLYEYPRVRIVSRRTGQMFEVEPLIRDAAGFYPEISATIGETFRAQSLTDSQRAMADINDIDLPTLDQVHTNDDVATPDDTAPTPAIVAFVPTEPDEVTVYTRLQARKLLLERLGAQRLDDLIDHQQAILLGLPDRVTRPELDEIHHTILAAESAPIIDLKGQQA